MSKPYPVVHQRPLAEPPKRGPFGLGTRRRTADELPPVAAHEVLVFRVEDGTSWTPAVGSCTTSNW